MKKEPEFVQPTSESITGLPPHQYKAQDRTVKKPGWEKRTNKMLVHLKAGCRRCQSERA